MKRFAFCMVILSAMALVGTAWAEDAKRKQSLCLELDLVDGSHVIGTPSIESVPLQTAYAKMDVALKQILTIRIAEDHENATIALRNEDKIKGTISLGPIELETVFGKISVGIENIKEIRIVPPVGELMRGLVLNYSFDKDENGKVIDKSGRENDGSWIGAALYEAGIKGQAARFRSKDTYIVSSSPRLNMNGWAEATVSLWVSSMGHTGYGHIINRGPLSTDQAGAFDLSVGGVYGGGVIFRSGPTNVVADVCETKLTLNRWYHLTMTYDGAKVCYYIDGKVEKEVAAKEHNAPLWDGPDTKLVIGNMSRIPFINWSDMYFNGLVDEVYIFNRALTGDEVKQIYDLQK